jgi:hypothetical protein
MRLNFSGDRLITLKFQRSIGLAGFFLLALFVCGPAVAQERG